MPYTTLVAGTTITASWANASVRDQVVTPFASVSARDSAITTPVTGMVAVTTDTMSVWLRKSGAWRSLRGCPDQYKVRLWQNVGCSIAANGVFTAVTWDSEYSGGDPSSWHSTSANTSRITPDVSGTLAIAYSFNTGTTASWATAGMRKNGASLPEFGQTQNPGPVGSQWGCTGLAFVDVNGSSDYVELYGAQGTAGALTTDKQRTSLMAWLYDWT